MSNGGLLYSARHSMSTYRHKAINFLLKLSDVWC